MRSVCLPRVCRVRKLRLNCRFKGWEIVRMGLQNWAASEKWSDLVQVSAPALGSFGNLGKEFADIRSDSFLNKFSAKL